MKKHDFYELNELTETYIKRIEQALRLHNGTIKTELAPPRASENGDFYIKIGFVDHGKSYE